MSKEAPHFGLTEREQLFDRVSHERFLAILDDGYNTIREMKLSTNNYGEFLFVTVSRPQGEQHEGITFWGYGYHDYRERWFTEEWFWHRSTIYPNTLERRIARDEAQEILGARLQEITPYLEEGHQSQRGALFELLAEMTDEDGAYIELEDLGDVPDLFEGDGAGE